MRVLQKILWFWVAAAILLPGTCCVRVVLAGELLKKGERQVILRISRDTLSLYLNKHKLPSLKHYRLTPVLKQNRGVFVTLKRKKDDGLRGCIGYIYGVKPLCEAVRDCTVESATRDRRFPPMEKGEEDSVYIEISVLTPPKKIKSVNEITVGKHGLIIEKGLHRGVLLPQVPVEWGWNREEYLQAICRKAGLPSGAWKKGSDLYVFSAQVFSEKRP